MIKNLGRQHLADCISAALHNANSYFYNPINHEEGAE